MKVPSRHVLLAAGLGFLSLLCTRREAPGRIDGNEASLGGVTVLEGVQPLLVEMLCLMWSLMLVRAWSMTEGDSNALIGDRPKFFDPAPVSLDWQNCWLGHLEVAFIEHQHSLTHNLRYHFVPPRGIATASVKQDHLQAQRAPNLIRIATMPSRLAQFYRSVA